MKFRDPKTGDVFEDKWSALNQYCIKRTCENCGLPNDCCKFISDHPAEAARLMGLEVVEESTMGQVNQIEQSTKPRICEVLGVDVGERFGIDGYPADYGLVQVCEDGKIRRVISTQEFPFAADGEVGHKIGSNALYYLLNHPERIIRKPRFTAEEVAVLSALQKAGVAEIERGSVHDTLKAKSRTVNDGDGCHYEQWFLPKGLLPSLRAGQSITLSDIVHGNN